MLFRSPTVKSIALVLIFGLALAIRLSDLTDLPLDFHPTRQLLSTIKARALYYETQPDGISTSRLESGIYLAQLKADVEPVVFERLVAFTYRFTGEQVWIARIYSSVFWLIGGIFLFLLVRDLTSFGGALFSTAYYLFFPYAVIASRSFQPDPLMVMLTISFWWVFSRWVAVTPNSPAVKETWKWVLLAGLVGGFAIFIKFSAAFFVIGAALGLAHSRLSLRELFHNVQVWMMVALGIIPSALYLVYGIFFAGNLAGQFEGRFFPALLLSPLNYLERESQAGLAAGGLFIMLGLLGFVLVKEKQMRGLMTGLWSAYVVYGLFFDYHIATHDYYHLPFIPVVALSLSPLGGWFMAHLDESAVHRYQRSVVYILLMYGLLSDVWAVRNQMKAVDYRPEAARWVEISERLGDSAVIALTQDYGSRIEYWGLRTVTIWPYTGDLDYSRLRGGGASFAGLFKEYSEKKDLFLVTDYDELKRQVELNAQLDGYSIYAQGDGYIIYDLQHPLRH